MNRFRISFITGVAITCLTWLFLILVLLPERTTWAASALGLAYNIPITLPFAVLGVELLLSLRSRPLRENAPYLLTWTLGGILLFFRVGLEAVAISGHMTWLVLMLTHSIVRGLPNSFSAVVALVLLQASFFNFALFPQHVSGFNGLLAGTSLGVLLLAVRYWLGSQRSGALRSPKGAV
jgi:hypothetical protein